MNLAETLFRIPRQPGLQRLQRRGDGSARELTSYRLCLDAGQEAHFASGAEEAILVLQQGAGVLRSRDEAWPISRRGVFEEKATALYLPPGSEVEVAATTALEAVIVSTPAEPRGGGPVLIPPEQVVVHDRGKDGYRREVHDVLVGDPYAQRLMAGETFNPPGGWSSFPPHKHDGRDGEPRLEEVYYYRIDPPAGFGQQLLYDERESVAHTVRDGDVVLIPHGYHPVAAPPGYRLCYFWVLAGEERRLALFEDPAHRWIHGLET